MRDTKRERLSLILSICPITKKELLPLWESDGQMYDDIHKLVKANLLKIRLGKTEPDDTLIALKRLTAEELSGVFPCRHSDSGDELELSESWEELNVGV